MPRSTVEILCVAKATGNEISKSNNIAGSCIIPAPPPEKAEKRLETKDIKKEVTRIPRFMFYESWCRHLHQ